MSNNDLHDCKPDACASPNHSPAALTSAALIDMYQRTFTLLHAYDVGQLPNQAEVAETLAQLHNQAMPK